MIGRTEEVATALSLRPWGGPFDALAYVCGRDALCWYRAWLACGRSARVGTTVQDPHQVRRALVAAEQLRRVAKPQVSVPPPVGGGWFLGVSGVEAADTVTWERGYGEVATDAKALDPTSQARAGCPAGWEATRQAWHRLFPTIPVVLGLLHALLKMQQHGAGPLRHRVLARAWQVSQAATTRQLAQRLRRLAAWPPVPLSGPVATRVWKRCRRRADCPPA